MPLLVIIIGIDPGLASCGWAVIERKNDGGLICWDAGVIRTKKEKGYTYDDDLRRLKIITDEMVRLRDGPLAHMRDGIGRQEWTYRTPSFIACESMSWPRHTRAVQAIAFCWGVIGAVFNHESLVQRRPQQIKVDLTGSKSATKADVERETCERVRTLEHHLDKLPKGQRDHAADAAAAVVSAWEDPMVKLAWKFSREKRD
tara:strand:- start:118 stop:720 length:603 start_codon:yes stop_codon:yes gene_type:complete